MAFDPLVFRANRPPIGTVLGASGNEYPIPDPMLWPDVTQKLVDGGQFAEAVAGILGAEAFDDFVARGGTATMLMEHIGSLLGDKGGTVNVGESSASGN